MHVQVVCGVMLTGCWVGDGYLCCDKLNQCSLSCSVAREDVYLETLLLLHFVHQADIWVAVVRYAVDIQVAAGHVHTKAVQICVPMP